MTDFDDIQFDNEPVPVAPSPVQPLGDSLGIVNECARALAQLHKLDSGAGLALCWGCKGSQGVTYPTLHCEACLKAFRERESDDVTLVLNGHPYKFPRYSEASWRFEAIRRNLEDSSYDQETCDRILENVRQLPHGKGITNFEALQAVYDRRFGARRAPQRQEADYGDD